MKLSSINYKIMSNEIGYSKLVIKALNFAISKLKTTIMSNRIVTKSVKVKAHRIWVKSLIQSYLTIILNSSINL